MTLEVVFESHPLPDVYGRRNVEIDPPVSKEIKMTDQREEMEAELEAMVEAEVANPTAGKSGQERLDMLMAKLEEKYPEAFKQSAEEIEAATGPPPSVRYCLAESH